MKRIVNGVTYNTATATLVASLQIEADDSNPKNYLGRLYQTRGGALFVHEHQWWGFYDKDEGVWVERQSDNFDPKNKAQAEEWALQDNIEIVLDGVVTEPPEAVAEAEPTAATIYLRVPAALKQEIERAATKADQSINEWATRCLESGLPKVTNVVVAGLRPQPVKGLRLRIPSQAPKVAKATVTDPNPQPVKGFRLSIPSQAPKVAKATVTDPNPQPVKGFRLSIPSQAPKVAKATVTDPSPQPVKGFRLSIPSQAPKVAKG